MTTVLCYSDHLDKQKVWSFSTQKWKRKFGIWVWCHLLPEF